MQDKFRNQFNRPQTLGDRFFGGRQPQAEPEYVDDVPTRDVDEDVVQGRVTQPATPKGLAVRGQQGANALVSATDGRVSLGRLTLMRLDMVIPNDLDKSEYEQLRDIVIHWDDASQWWLGDLLSFGELVHGESYRLMAKKTSKAVKTLRNYAWVARKVEMSRRRDTLSFGHHEAVAGLLPEDQSAWLDYADRQGFTVPELRAAIRGEKPPKPAAAMPDEIKRHLVFLASLNGIPYDRVAKEELRVRIHESREWLDALENKLQ